MSRVLPIVASFLPVLSLHRELFIKTRSYGNTFSGECRVTSTTVVIFGRRDLAENMHDVCTIASLFRYSCSFLTYRDNLQGNWRPFYRFSTTSKIFTILIVPDPSPVGLSQYRYLISYVLIANSWIGINISFGSDSRKTPQTDSRHFSSWASGFPVTLELISRNPEDQQRLFLGEQISSFRRFFRKGYWLFLQGSLSLSRFLSPYSISCT